MSNNKDEKTFWADEVASEIAKKKSKYVGATGITPSGEIHIGNMREVVTADAVTRALQAQGKKTELIYIADTFDPLRRVYPFLDEKTYTPHIGKPLSEIPGPNGSELSYAEHFLKPFLESLEKLDIRVRVVRADQLYKEGQFTENIIRALESKDEIRKILKKETGKETSETWSPFNAICEKDGRMDQTEVTGFDATKKEVLYKCACGHEGAAPMAGGGKLVWRVDWPARWQILGVTYEPFGKDHGSAGGSYDTGIRISREIFDYDPPSPIVYEWISLRGGGDMSSSKGNVISIHRMLEVVPPDVLKYAVVKVKPNRRIVFDPGLPTLSLMDEFDDPASKNRNPRAAELSEVSGHPPLGVPFRHIVVSAQIARHQPDEMIKVLERSGYANLNKNLVIERANYAKRWLEEFAPEDMRFEIQEELPDLAKDLSDVQKKALQGLGEDLKGEMNAEEVHSLIYAAKEKLGVQPKEIFEAIYRSILGKERGPRAGFFLASLDADFVKKRFQEAAQG